MLLELHSRLTIHRLDITQQEDINSLCQELREVPINILINNAGVYFRKRSVGIDCIHYDNWRRTFEVNTLGPVRITEALLGNIAESTTVRLIVVLSSHMGRIAENNEVDSFYYRSSKSALNVAMQGISAEMKEQGIGVLLLHPGAVMTRIGPLKGISTRESVSGMRQIIEGFTMEQTGKFFSYDGEEIPW